MNCRFKNNNVERKLEYERGVASGVDTMLIVFTYVLSCFGYKGVRIQQIVSKIEDVCDSINKGYVTHQDLEDEFQNEEAQRMVARRFRQ